MLWNSLPHWECQYFRAAFLGGILGRVGLFDVWKLPGIQVHCLALCESSVMSRLVVGLREVLGILSEQLMKVPVDFLAS